MKDPYRPVDDDARRLAADLLSGARHAALAFLRPEGGPPGLSRVGFMADGGDGLLLVSSIAEHSAALAPGALASLMVGEPGLKGDPLTHPRLSLSGTIEDEDKALWKERWLASHPKAKLWYDFSDFRLVRLRSGSALLNGGFGAAFRFGPDDLPPRTNPSGAA